jgi:hypothetical protein
MMTGEDEVAEARANAERDALVRQIARAVREIEPGLVTRDGGGFARIAASRFHGGRHQPDLTRFCGYWPAGDGWVVRVSDPNGKCGIYHDMWLPDEHLDEDRQGEVDATAAGSVEKMRVIAYGNGWRPGS